MKIQKASLFFESLLLIGGLKYIFPSLVSCVDQNGGPHHKESIFQHCMDAGDYIHPKYWKTKLTGYLHDVGKPPAAIIDDKTHQLKFINHEGLGSDLIKNELTYLRFSNNEIDFISHSIKLHMGSFNKKLSKRALKRFLVRIKENNLTYKDWFRLFIADKKANRKSRNFTFGELKSFIFKIKYLYDNEHVFSIRDLDINGDHIMEILNIEPGVRVGIILKELFEHCLNYPEHNNREFLISLVENYK